MRKALGKMKDPESRDLAKAFKGLRPESRALVKSLVPEIADTTIQHLLWSLEQDERISLSVEAGGKTVSRLQDAGDGLSGEVHGGSRWTAKYSKQRR